MVAKIKLKPAAKMDELQIHVFLSAPSPVPQSLLVSLFMTHLVESPHT